MFAESVIERGDLLLPNYQLCVMRGGSKTHLGLVRLTNGGGGPRMSQSIEQMKNKQFACHIVFLISVIMLPIFLIMLFFGLSTYFEEVVFTGATMSILFSNLLAVSLILRSNYSIQIRLKEILP